MVNAAIDPFERLSGSLAGHRKVIGQLQIEPVFRGLTERLVEYLATSFLSLVLAARRWK